MANVHAHSFGLNRARTVRVSALLAVALAVFSMLSLVFGSSEIPCADIFSALFFGGENETAKLVLWEIRLPRLCAAMLCGSSLAVAGVGMQSLFRNPLADPSVTGVSSGAALGAVIAMTFFGSVVSGEILALVFGLGAAFAVCSTGSAFLAGIAVNAFCGALVGFFMYTVRDAGMRGFVFWSLGSLERCGWAELAAAFALCVPSQILVYTQSRAMNLLLLGEESAFHGGVDVRRVRLCVIAASAVMTAACVSICGIIGFVGLVVPHILRMLTTPDNRTLVPLSALGGALLLTFSDVAARAVSQTDPVPIGVITALLGAPFFAFLLKSKGLGNG